MLRARTPRHLRIGKRGETLAAWYLRLSGYRIVDTNFRCRLGEIDIIAGKGNLLVFVEVRTRASGSLQPPVETVDAVKVSRTVQAARTCLRFSGQPLPFCRFDVIGITTQSRFPWWRIRHTKDAFNLASGDYEEGCRKDIARKKRKFEGPGAWKLENGEWKFRGKEGAK